MQVYYTLFVYKHIISLAGSDSNEKEIIIITKIHFKILVLILYCKLTFKSYKWIVKSLIKVS